MFAMTSTRTSLLYAHHTAHATSQTDVIVQLDMLVRIVSGAFALMFGATVVPFAALTAVVFLPIPVAASQATMAPNAS